MNNYILHIENMQLRLCYHIGGKLYSIDFLNGGVDLSLITSVPTTEPKEIPNTWITL